MKELKNYSFQLHIYICVLPIHAKKTECEIDGDPFTCACQTPDIGRTCKEGIKYYKTPNFKLKYVSLKRH